MSEPTSLATDPPALVPLAASIRAAKLGFRRCFYAESGGCSGAKCHRLGRAVELRDCVECLGPLTEDGR